MTDAAQDVTPSAPVGESQPAPSGKKPTLCLTLGLPTRPAESSGTENPLQQKYEEYRQVLATNPEDFQTWTYLLSTVERLVCTSVYQEKSDMP